MDRLLTQILPLEPPVTWAQTKDSVFITFHVECDKPEMIIERKAVTYEGVAKPDKKFYAVVIELFASIDPKRSSYTNKGKYVEVFLTKVDSSGPFWPTLTFDQKKYHWINIDEERWQQEKETYGGKKKHF